MKHEKRNLLVWCGLTQHHAESARNLPETTVELVHEIRRGLHTMVEGLLLVPITTDNEFTGFGIQLVLMSTPLTPFQVRTKCDLPLIYREEISKVRALFRKLGFTRAANMYVSAVDM